MIDAGEPWSQERVFVHLKATFEAEFDRRPDLLEPYVIRLDGLDEQAQTEIMREGLRETFNRRHPSRFAKPPTS